jgi:Bifunctional DNA primase/polymerase, N-terminal/Family of unknown function (DUF5906)
MTSKLDHALALAKHGLRVFPLIEGGKLPAIDGWPEKATTDVEQIKAWWTDPVLGWPRDYNIGIATGDGLTVLDVDNKGKKKGNDSLALLADLYGPVPSTPRTLTPTGGLHLFFRCDVPLRNSAGKLGDGLDVRGYHGFVVAPGSELVNEHGHPSGTYKWIQEPVDGDVLPEMPRWLLGLCERADPDAPAKTTPLIELDTDAAVARTRDYLISSAPRAVEGQHGDTTTFQVAARCKDLGVSEATAADLMLEHWNPTCSPPWDPEELQRKVANAYRYGTSAPGAAAPEAQFEPVEETGNSGQLDNDIDISADALTALTRRFKSVSDLNREFAFIIAGGGHHVLWETVDPRGQATIEHLNEQTFNKLFASVTRMPEGAKKPIGLTALWMNSPLRRTYQGIDFAPMRDALPGFYNLWRGFAIEPPADIDMQRAVQGCSLWLEHLRDNVCRGDKGHAAWLLNWFAHLVQRPWEKPLVAVVFKGKKGVGKNALVRYVAAMLGQHALTAANRRLLVSNFNGHLEKLLLFVLDEAFWSGDKQAEGVLKDLVTGGALPIEHKGKEPFTVPNLMRIVIIGNEEWLVPASEDERRWAVFDVGEGRQQDTAFFESLDQQMANGGTEALLWLLQHTELAPGNIVKAPATAALLEQKEASLDPFCEWWLTCLIEGRIEGLTAAWATEVPCDDLRDCFLRYAQRRSIRGRLPDERIIGRMLKKVCKSSDRGRGPRPEQVRIYKLPGLEAARAEWCEFMRQPRDWD